MRRLPAEFEAFSGAAFSAEFEGAAFSAEFEAAFTAHGDLLAAFSAEFPGLLFKITLNSRSVVGTLF